MKIDKIVLKDSHSLKQDIFKGRMHDDVVFLLLYKPSVSRSSIVGVLFALAMDVHPKRPCFANRFKICGSKAPPTF